MPRSVKTALAVLTEHPIDSAAVDLVSYAPIEKKDMKGNAFNISLGLGIAAIIIRRGVVGCC